MALLKLVFELAAKELQLTVSVASHVVIVKIAIELVTDIIEWEVADFSNNSFTAAKASTTKISCNLATKIITEQAVGTTVIWVVRVGIATDTIRLLEKSQPFGAKWPCHTVTNTSQSFHAPKSPSLTFRKRRK